MSRMHPNPSPVVALDVTIVAVIIVAVAAPFAFGAYQAPRCRPESPTDCGAVTSAEGAADDGAKGAAKYDVAKVLRRSLMSWHQKRRPEQRRYSQISKHFIVLHSGRNFSYSHRAGNGKEPAASLAGRCLACA